MKLTKNTTNIKTFLILFLLLSSFMISVHTETSKAKKFQKKLLLKKNNSENNSLNLKNKGNLSRTKSKSKDFDMEKAMNIFEFILGMMTCLPVIDDYAEILEEFIENSDKCDKKKIIEAYKRGVEKRKEKTFASSIKTLDELENTKSHFVWKPTDETETIMKNLEKTNPKKACEAILTEQERQVKENKKYIEIYKGALIAAKELKENLYTIDEFIEKLPFAHLPTIFNSDSKNNYLNLKHFLKRTMFAHLELKSIDEFKLLVYRGKISWKKTIRDAVDFLSDNNKMAKLNLQELGFSGDDMKPDCSNLPTNALLEENKTTILDHFAGGWSALKFVGKCVLDSMPNQGLEFVKGQIIELLKELGMGFLKMLITVFATTTVNSVTFFSAKAIKILYWLVKAIYYIYKALSDESSKYKYWGKAVGSGIRLIYTAFMPTERRRLKLKKF